MGERIEMMGLLATVLQSDEICRGENKDLCVSGATCDQKSQRCTCKGGFSELDDVCGKCLWTIPGEYS